MNQNEYILSIVSNVIYLVSYENRLLSKVYGEVGTLVQRETGTNLPFFIPVSDSLRHDA
jgi:hypothetical protein